MLLKTSQMAGWLSSMSKTSQMAGIVREEAAAVAVVAVAGQQEAAFLAREEVMVVVPSAWLREWTSMSAPGS